MLSTFAPRFRIIFLLGLLLASPVLLWGNGCFKSHSACRVLGSVIADKRGVSAAFVGVALASTKELKPGDIVSVRVEEVFWGLAADTEIVHVVVLPEIGAPYPLVKGERYAFDAQRDETDSTLLQVSTCSHTFRVRGREQRLDAIRKARRGMPPSLVGTVSKHVSGEYIGDHAIGVRVIAINNDLRHETVSDTNGEFSFLNLSPGEWRIRVDDPLYEQDMTYAHRANVSITKACDEVSLSVWPKGSISGILRGADGMPIANVPVQAFLRDWQGKWNISPVHTVTSDHEGRYVLGALPRGEILVAVNGRESSDSEVWPATYYPGVHSMAAALPITLTEGQQHTGADLILPEARTPVEISVAAYFEDEQPAEQFKVSLRSTDGRQRASGSRSRDALLTAKLPTVTGFLGTTYVVEAWASLTLPNNRFVQYRGEAHLTITANHPVSIRVVLREAEP